MARLAVGVAEGLHELGVAVALDARELDEHARSLAGIASDVTTHNPKSLDYTRTPKDNSKSLIPIALDPSNWLQTGWKCRTSDAHLGQIITYAAGVGAKKVVWVAESFRPEHVAALEFLNQNTTEDLNFFAVEMELWRIADSPMAPSFNVVVKPNDWSKEGRESARAAVTMTPTKQLQLRFWTALVQYIEAHKLPLKPQKALPQSWLVVNTIGRSGFHVAATANSREARLGAEFYIYHPESKAIFAKLHAQREAIEKQLGFVPEWQELPERHACRITVFRPNSDLADESAWPAYCAWLADKLVSLSSVFPARVKEL
ncbi:MAG: DUF4268 domain-containing protein [Rubrivivax sp.]|nr:DUF4268 domain-containing protein [Rubrivivax sp.]